MYVCVYADDGQLYEDAALIQLQRLEQTVCRADSERQCHWVMKNDAQLVVFVLDVISYVEREKLGMCQLHQTVVELMCHFLVVLITMI